MQKKRNPVVEAGFTLIELMIVVVIILILATVAYYGYRKWIDKSKETEASLNLKAIYNGAQAFFSEEHAVSATSVATVSRQLPTPKALGPVAADSGCCIIAGAGGTEKCAPGAATDTTWSVAPWTQIKFAMDKGHYFGYGYDVTSAVPTTASTTVNGDAFEAIAYGDLDCDGSQNAWVLGGSVTADGIKSAGSVFEVAEGAAVPTATAATP